MTFATTVPLEGVHPLQSGLLRMKHPSERRPGLPRENPWLFWPRFAWNTVHTHAVLVGTYAKLRLLQRAIARDPDGTRLHGPRAQSGRR